MSTLTSHADDCAPESVHSASRARTACAGSLVAMLRFHQVAADSAQIEHIFSGVPPTLSEMERYLRRTGLRGRATRSSR